MDGGGSESLSLQAWLENSASIDNANEGDGGDHADSGPVSSIGQIFWLHRVPETPQEELGGHVADTCEAVQGDEVGDGVENPRSEHPKGFYEVEAIRSQWMREDIQTQNLIEWLDRPNTANSCDPLNNLRNVPDLNDAFEERIKSTNQSRCKDKQGDQNTQPEWLQRSITPCILVGNQQQSTSRADVNHADVDALPQDDDIPTHTTRELLNSNEKISTVPTVGIFDDFQQLSIFENSKESRAFYGPSMVNSREPVQNERPRGAKKRKSGPVKRFIRVPLEFEPVEQASAAVASGSDNYGDINHENVDENNLDVVEIINPVEHILPHENNTGQQRIFGNSNDNSTFYGPSMVNGREPVQNGCPKGAKKRKSGPVKRFVRVPPEFEPAEQASAAVADSRDNYGDINLETVDENNLDIVKIISPIHYVPSRETTTGESFILFLALRSNGEETLVSNRNLRASNPKLLFKYYEKNLSVHEA